MNEERWRFSYPLNLCLIKSLPPEHQAQKVLRAWLHLMVLIRREVPSYTRIVWSCEYDKWDCQMIAEVIP